MTVGLLSIASPAAPSGLIINLVYDANWSGAPAWYQSGIITAANAIMAACPNTNITVNIEVGYGFLENVQSVGASSSVGTYIGSAFLTYSAIRAALVANNKTTAMNSLIANTPAGSSLNSTSNFNVTSACEKALGLNGISPTAPGLDGAIGVGSGWSAGEVVGMFLHELTHAMGRVPQIAPFVFSRFTAVGTRDFNASTSGTYFSLDGGTTHLADYDGSSDVSDFLNTTGVQDGGVSTSWDCFDAFQNSTSKQSLSTVDIQLLNSMGFQ